jgi:hypothetical protein
MHESAIVGLPDYLDEINRSKLRFCGIGPRMLKDPSKIWPRDAINPDAEANKILYSELTALIGDQNQIETLAITIRNVFTRLQRCNLRNLFDKCCPIDVKCLSKPLNTIDAMQAYTTHNQILNFVHHILKTIKIDGSPGNHLAKLFGSNKNFNIYKQHLKWLVIGNAKMTKLMIGPFVHFEHLSIDLSKVTWLNGLTETAKYRVFIQLVYRITWFIAQTLRRYFYITVSNPYYHKLFYYRFDLWQKFQAQVIDMHKQSRLFEKVRLSDQATIPPKNTSKIRFHLKRDDLRLICTNSRISDEHHYLLKAVLMYVVRNMPYSDRYRPPKELLDGIKEMQEQSIKKGKPIYVIRADMENCFHSIDQDKLRAIIINFLSSAYPNGELKFYKLMVLLKNARKGRPKWTLDPESEKNRDKYLNVTMTNQSKIISLEKFDRDFINPLIIKPILMESSKSKFGYKLMSGIRQGSRASPILCGIYIRAAFNNSIADILKSDDSRCFFHVDDILLMTTCLQKAEKFLDTMMEGIAYFNLKSNPNKLAINFDSKKHQVSQLNEFVLFYKRKIDLRTLGCSYSFSSENISIDNMFAVSPYMDEQRLRVAAKNFTKIEAIFLDFDINGVDRVFENIFENALFVAYRVVTIMNLSFVLRNSEKQRPNFVARLVKMVAKRLFTCLESAMRIHLVVNSMNYKEVHLIVLAAFLVTWQMKKVRHRAMEREYLDRQFNRRLIRYAIFHTEGFDETETRGQHFERIIRGLIKKFPTSLFNREMLLPNKY